MNPSVSMSSFNIWVIPDHPISYGKVSVFCVLSYRKQSLIFKSGEFVNYHTFHPQAFCNHQAVVTDPGVVFSGSITGSGAGGPLLRLFSGVECFGIVEQSDVPMSELM